MEASSHRRSDPVAITGMGVVSPFGVGVEAFADALLAGRPGLRVVDDLKGEAPRLCGQVPELLLPGGRAARRLRRMPRVVQMAVVAAQEAVAEASLEGRDRDRVGVILGTGLGALETTVDFMTEYTTLGPGQANPALFPVSVMNAAAAQISMDLGLRGYSTTVNHRDASALAAVALGVDLIRLGRVGAVVCGGVDELSGAALHGFRRLGELTTGSRSDSVRPFDRRRDGFALGEGAALFLLEPQTSPRAAVGDVRGWIRGVGMGSEDRAPLSWNGDGTGAAAAIQQALTDAGLPSEEVGYVAAGANGSRFLDRLEALTLRRAFGARAVPVSSILGQIGDHHSAAGLRLAAAVIALERQQVPGTFGFAEADRQASVPGLVVQTAAMSVEAALVAAHATGGAEVALVLGREVEASVARPGRTW